MATLRDLIGNIGLAFSQDPELNRYWTTSRLLPLQTQEELKRLRGVTDEELRKQRELERQARESFIGDLTKSFPQGLSGMSPDTAYFLATKGGPFTSALRASGSLSLLPNLGKSEAETELQDLATKRILGKNAELQAGAMNPADIGRTLSDLQIAQNLAGAQEAGERRALSTARLNTGIPDLAAKSQAIEYTGNIARGEADLAKTKAYTEGEGPQLEALRDISRNREAYQTSEASISNRLPFEEAELRKQQIETLKRSPEQIKQIANWLYQSELGKSKLEALSSGTKALIYGALSNDPSTVEASVNGLMKDPEKMEEVIGAVLGTFRPFVSRVNPLDQLMADRLRATLGKTTATPRETTNPLPTSDVINFVNLWNAAQNPKVK